MATIYIDGKAYEVSGDDNLLHACLSKGIDVPYFCWHPALGSVGACRQCAVKQYRDANDKVGHLVMSCMTPCSDGTHVSVQDEEAQQFRASVVEWLMTNHPHDCPVCEEGGHCHLQDMTVMTRHVTRRYRFEKRTHRNQDLGPFINHEMNRCIACYRCVRYYKDYAGGTDLGVFGSAHNIYFGRAADGKLESEFSGNLVEVCPTGVFTDKTHGERYNRKWDMQFAPSICQGCSVGCNISPGERYGELRRIENRYNGAVNHYFLCDRGRFGYGYVNRKDRPRQPLVRQEGELKPVEPNIAIARAADLLMSARGTVGIGSPRASLESNFALRSLVGAQNFFDGHATLPGELTGHALKILKTCPLPIASLRGIEESDAVLVLGEDPSNTAPRVALAIRRSAHGKAVALGAAIHVEPWHAAAIADIGQHQKNPICLASTSATRLDDIATWAMRAAPDDIARFGFAVAHALDAGAPAVPDLDDATLTLARKVADSLLAAAHPLIVSGTGPGSAAVLDAANNVAHALKARDKQGRICLIAPEVNSLGVAMLHEQNERGLEAALATIERGEADTLVVLENDLFRRTDRSRIEQALSKAKLIVLDHQMHETAARADVVLSSASFVESDGTVVSQEARAQRYFKVFEPGYYDSRSIILDSWTWLRDLYAGINGKNPWPFFDTLTAATAEAVPALKDIVNAAPNAQFRLRGQKVARAPHRYSGRTAMRANVSVHEPRQPQDADSALAFSMEGHNGVQLGDRPAALIPFAWAPGWNSPQSWNKFQEEVGGILRGGDPGARLIEPAEWAAPTYSAGIPPAFAPASGTRLLLPLAHVFGSDELTSRAPPLENLVPAPYVALSEVDAATLQLSSDDLLPLALPGGTVRLAVQVRADLPAGTLGLPAGTPNAPWFVPGTFVSLKEGPAA